MNIIQNDKRVFFDADGNLLENGYVYIGQPSTYPLEAANRKTVTFEDNSGSQFTASQPLRTIKGKIVYNGQPIKALVDGEHSMLVLDANQTQIDYSASIVPSSTDAATGSTIQVGLTLSDVKAIDVSVGDVCRSVGKITATDGLGADWLVISATGSPGNDVDLIDFDNGLQGQVDLSKIYRREGVGTFILDDPITVLTTTDASSYHNVWTDIPLAAASIPSTASSVIIRLSLSAVYPTSAIADNLTIFAYARKNGSAVTDADRTRVGASWSQTNANDTNPTQFVSEFTVPLSGDAFELRLVINDPTSGAGNTTPDMVVNVIGYTINPE